MLKTYTLYTLFMLLFLSTSMAQTPQAKQDLSIAEFEAKLKSAGGDAQILDARSQEEFDQNHLKGAVLLSVKNEAALQQQISLLKKDHPVFVYSIGNGRSSALAKKLKEQHFAQVSELPGGISHWIGSGRPVESSVGAGYSLKDYELLTHSGKLVLVDVSSRYCGACKKLAPVVDSIARENTAGLKLVKIEFFENKKLAQDLHVQAIPHLILYKDNKIVWEKTGVTPRAEIQAVIARQVGVN